MTSFKLHHNKPETGYEQSIIDDIIDSYGGVALPGKWGLAQALMEVWTRPLPEQEGAMGVLQKGMWVAKSALTTTALVKEYKRSNDPMSTQAVNDPIAAFIKAKKITLLEGMTSLSHMIHVYAALHVPFVDTIIRKDIPGLIRTFTTPSGYTFYYVFPYSHPSDIQESAHFAGKGPYILAEQSADIRRELGEMIWTAEGRQDLQLSVSSDDTDTSFVITNIGSPDDYVSEGAADLWQDVGKLSRRLQAFKVKKRSRKIMFYGPPGCGKTTLARSMARELGDGMTLRIEADAVEEAGTGAVMLFVKLLSPRVVLFDDLDRYQDTTEAILHYMEQGGEEWASGLVVIGTANAIEELDPALLRPGRFDEVIEVLEPTKEHLLPIVQHYLHKYSLTDRLSAKSMVDLMEGMAPAEVREILSCVSIVGTDSLDAELERVKRQRALYSGDSVGEYLRARRGGD